MDVIRNNLVLRLTEGSGQQHVADAAPTWRATGARIHLKPALHGIVAVQREKLRTLRRGCTSMHVRGNVGHVHQTRHGIKLEN